MDQNAEIVRTGRTTPKTKKVTGPNIVALICDTVNKSLEAELLHEDGKNANISLIIKKCTRKQPANYQQVKPTSVLVKVKEWLVIKAIL